MNNGIKFRELRDNKLIFDDPHSAFLRLVNMKGDKLVYIYAYSDKKLKERVDKFVTTIRSYNENVMADDEILIFAPYYFTMFHNIRLCFCCEFRGEVLKSYFSKELMFVRPMYEVLTEDVRNEKVPIMEVTKDMLFQVRDYKWIRDDVFMCKKHIEEMLNNPNTDEKEFYDWLDHMDTGLDMITNTHLADQLPYDTSVQDLKNWARATRSNNRFN